MYSKTLTNRVLSTEVFTSSAWEAVAALPVPVNKGLAYLAHPACA